MEYFPSLTGDKSKGEEAHVETWGQESCNLCAGEEEVGISISVTLSWCSPDLASYPKAMWVQSWALFSPSEMAWEHICAVRSEDGETQDGGRC